MLCLSDSKGNIKYFMNYRRQPPPAAYNVSDTSKSPYIIATFPDVTHGVLCDICFSEEEKRFE